MRVLMLFDLAQPAPPRQSNASYEDDLESDDWESEACVYRALLALGHDVRLFGFHNDIYSLLNELCTWQPDTVFNLCEAFRQDRGLEPCVAALLELYGVRFTGARAHSLGLCKDKVVAKTLVAAEDVRVPRYVLARRGSRLRGIGALRYPVLVKPLSLEASAGISRQSYARNEREALARAAFVHERLGQDALIEEYIEGRELYVGVLGDFSRGDVEVLPPRELFFGSVSDSHPKFATFKAKWDDAYRERWGIKTGPARALGAALGQKISATCQRICRALRITGYARIDLRLTPARDLFFLEANPNPSIAMSDDFAQAAIAADMRYEELISRILGRVKESASSTRSCAGRRKSCRGLLLARSRRR